MEEPDLDVYPSIFNQHLQETQEHLRGATPTTEQLGTHIIGSVSWTSAEIDSFFHALTIHSRLRPDLISASVRTKSVLEVVEYLDLLEVNSRRAGRQFSGGSETPIAYKMSEDWISWEETQAQSLRAREDSSILRMKETGTRQMQCLLTAAKDTIPSSGSSSYRPLVDHECDDSRELSPILRRRFQKRLCMRRKRARERGEEVNTTTALLKRGRRSKGHKIRGLKPNVRSLEPNPAQEHESLPDNLIPDLQHPSSRTDTGFLENEAKLIHVPNLRNFLRFRIGLYDKKLLDGGEDINPGAIELLTSMTQDFVSDIVYRAVVLQEEQKAMKGSIKVWRQRHYEADTIIIKQSTINQCLDSLVLGTRTRKQCFQGLLTSFDMQVDNDQVVPRRQADFTTPLRCEFLPRFLKSCNEPSSWFCSVDEMSGDSTSGGDNWLDKKDSVAERAYEVDLWTKINQ